MIGVVIFFETQIIPFENKCVEKQAKSVSVEIINSSMEALLNENDWNYSKISNINFSDDKNVKSIQIDTLMINEIKSKVTSKIQNELNQNEAYSFKVPLGAFTKLNEFSSIGPEMDISFRLSGSVDCKIKSTFENAGVNQTIHHIKAIITTKLVTLSPEYSKPIIFKTDYEIAQTVIIGNIPSTYVNVNKD